MALACGTRSLKNAKFLHHPKIGIFPPEEPLEGYSSVVPGRILSRLESVTPEEVEFERLKQVISKTRVPRSTGKIVEPLFSGTLRFVQATFSSSGRDYAVPPADLQTALEYSVRSAVPVSEYASQYGPNSLAVSSSLIPFQAPVRGGKYNDQILAGWVDQLVKSQGLSADSCLVFLNPQGVVNTDADATQGVLGYHSASPSGNPYIFVNVMGQGLTLADEKDLYALALSHEIEEMTVDPMANGSNPEISDPCSGNCGTDERNYFDSGSNWLGSSPTQAYAFFTAGVVKPASASECPAPRAACSYPPPKAARPPGGPSR